MDKDDVFLHPLIKNNRDKTERDDNEVSCEKDEDF